ncbi:hypothetical protein ACFYO1_02880 [Nocardia sp. NPDC006044]|uniref:hypothetical protein n=1 Tax=Nocardia sp. NPDC006044 TaxID=3364306 RepID=UPI003689AC22
MQTPTPLQMLLLNGIQNLAYDNWTRVEKSVAAGYDTPPPEVIDQITMSRRTLTQLEDLGALVGCPHSWLNFARRAGERGQASDARRLFYSPDEVPRGALIAALSGHIHQLQDSAGILAAHMRRNPGLDRGERGNFQAVMGMVWQRLGAVSHELDVTDRERGQMWSRHGGRHWANVVAQELTGHNDEQVSARFRTVADADISIVAAPVIVCLRSGIALDDISKQMPDSPDRMVELVGVALDAMPRDPHGLAVHDAVAATTLSENAGIEQIRDESAWGDLGLAAPQVPDYGSESEP